jgi:hypothetical protein
MPERVIIRVDSLEKVIEKLATTEKTTLAIAREEGGKIRVTSGSWDGEKVILKGQVLEVRTVDGRLYVSRKAKRPDEWDPPIELDSLLILWAPPEAEVPLPPDPHIVVSGEQCAHPEKIGIKLIPKLRSTDGLHIARS